MSNTQNTEDYHLLTRNDYDAEFAPIDNVAATARALSLEDNPEWLSAWVHRTDPTRYVAMFFRTETPDALTPAAYWRHPHNPTESPVTGDRTTLADGVRVVTSVSNGRVHYWRYADPLTAVHTSATLALWRALHRREDYRVA